MKTAVTPSTNNTHSSGQLPPPVMSDNPNSPTLSCGVPPSCLWNHVVRGEPVVTVIENNVLNPVSVSPPPFTESGGSDYNGNAGKKPVWNKPSNGDSSDTGSGSVMDGAMWPALSETGKAASRKSSTDSLKAVSDGSSSAPFLQMSGTASSSIARQTSKSSNSNSAPSNTATGSQRSMKPYAYTASFSSNRTRLNMSTRGPTSETQFNNHFPKNDGQPSSSFQRNHNNNDHQVHQNSFINHNGGQHPRGDQNYGGMLNHDYANPHRNFNGGDALIQQQKVVPRFATPTPPQLNSLRNDRPIAPPLNSAPFVAQHLRFARPAPPPFIAQPTRFVRPTTAPPPNSAPFVAQRPLQPAPFVAQRPLQPYDVSMGFHQPLPLYFVAAPPPNPPRGVSASTPLPYSAPDPKLKTKILFQIDYYFSNENMVKDIYLRQNMDEQGWVSINLIAGFNQVSSLTKNIELILDVVRSSSSLEVQGNKIRRRNDWMRWVLPRDMSLNR